MKPRQHLENVLNNTFKFWKDELMKIPEPERNIVREHLKIFYMRYIEPGSQIAKTANELLNELYSVGDK